MVQLLRHILDLFSTTPFLLLVETIALLIKSFIIAKLFLHRTEKHTPFQRAWLLLILILIGSILEDLTWVVKLLQMSNLLNIDYRFFVFMIRLAWIFDIIQYQSLALLIENLVPAHNKKLSLANQLFMTVSAIY